MAIDDRDIVHASTALPDGRLRLELSVPGIHCGGCIQKIETALTDVTNVASARVNLSTRRLTVLFTDPDNPPAIGTVLDRIGFDAFLSGSKETKGDSVYRALLKSLAVAAFAAMNIMMLSVAVWAGAEPETRQLFHWVSAAIALPALVYSGRVFYLSAWNALRHGRTNMDVPITVGLVVTYAMSLYDTVTAGAHAYFDAATSLLFFLLIGRTLDHMMRQKARSAIDGLQKLIPLGVTLLHGDGTTTYLTTDKIEPGMRIMLAAGDRVPVDGVIEKGRSEVDLSLVSGESHPVGIGPGSGVVSGGLNLSGAVVLRASAPPEGSYLADMIRLMERAEGVRGRFTRLADRVASLYAPVVHVTALAAFILWYGMGGDIHLALSIAVSVLIITCPCALALAVPMVQVTAARRLFDAGIMMKDGSALEKLIEVDTVFFDKTGTLTCSKPALINKDDLDPAMLKTAATLARHSRHPYAMTIADLWRQQSSQLDDADDVTEVPGSGIEGIIAGSRFRLGRSEWAVGDNDGGRALRDAGPVLTQDGRVVAEFRFEDEVRPESHEVVWRIQEAGLAPSVLSGDSETKVSKVAEMLGMQDYRSGHVPDQKLRTVERAVRDGRKPLMVGDGINDAPALAAAHVSIAPASATDVGRTAADVVLLKDDLRGIITLFDVARSARTLTVQNVGFALVYNAVAIPFAFFGYVTPLVAAIAMSTSSVIVVLNALRLNAPTSTEPVRSIA
ncbi:heavy metal translocating P-type ATPase [uncultured Tateyamaria sp.]|uniref:heavy metal translocating P-type ATPase n=1 Tax=uncultured Tateyamaria sp. TaxID=455651 RepID=UPI002638B107|nr:heavy metal translocating P-type ATPase [uncultured Tateyamaria sp.]